MTPLLLDLPMEQYLHALPALGRSSLARLLEQRRGAARKAAGTTRGDAGSTWGNAGSTRGDAESTRGNAGSTRGDAGSTRGDAGSTRGDAGSTRALDRPGVALAGSAGTAPPAERVRLGQRVHDAVLLAAGRTDWRAVTGTGHASAALAGDDETDEVRALLARDAFLRSPFGPLLASGLPELTVLWHEARAGAWLKARPDLLDPDGFTVWELKTVPRYDRAAATAFLAQPRNLLQSAMYRAAMRAATGRDWRFAWLTIELDAPRRIERHALPLHLARQGDWMLRDALAMVRVLPGRPGPLDPRDWARYALDATRARRLCPGEHGADDHGR